MDEKIQHLKETLAALESVAVAFSGGVDSAFLLAVAHETLGKRAIAITANTVLTPASEDAAAAAFCAERGIRQLTFAENQLESIPGFADNPRERCYICKRALFERIRTLASENGAAHVADGTNADDLGMHRPGSVALAELGVVNPLADCGFTKADIRAASRAMGLPTWDKPSMACLASRFEYGARITEEALARVEAVEAALFSMGFSQGRARVHGDVVRFEVPAAEIVHALDADMRERLVAAAKANGFKYATLDLQGFRIGSMDE